MITVFIFAHIIIVDRVRGCKPLSINIVSEKTPNNTARIPLRFVTKDLYDIKQEKLKINVTNEIEHSCRMNYLQRIFIAWLS